MRVLVVSVVAALLITGAASAQSLDDTNFTARFALPDRNTTYAGASFSPSSFTVGSGTETTVNIENVSFLSFDFSGDTLSIGFQTSLNNPTFFTGSYVGPVFASMSQLGLSGASVISTNLNGFDASRVSFLENEIGLNFSGLTYNSSTFVNVAFGRSAAAVPGPLAGAGLVPLIGLAGVAAVRRRRRSRAA